MKWSVLIMSINTIVKIEKESKKNIYINKQKQIDWLKNKEIIQIPIGRIRLVEPIHKFARVQLNEEIDHLNECGTTKIINPLIVKKNNEYNYSLVSNLKGYHLARALHQEFVSVVIIDYNREQYCQELGIKDNIKYGFRNPNSIIVKQNFIDAGVNEWKLQMCIDYYNDHGCMDKPIVVRDRVCLDGYARLCAAQHLNLEKVWVMYI
jgi:hypothetical protein